MKIVKILEAGPAIERKYLKYLEERGFKVCGFEEECNFNQVFVIIVRSSVAVDQKLLENYPNLNFVLRVGVGLDNIDLALCKEKNIKILNTPGANSDAVADMAMWGLLSLLRNGKKIVSDLNVGEFVSRFEYEGGQVSSQKIGIVGFGQIGKKFYQRCLGFGADNFCVVDPFLTKSEVEDFQYCQKYESLESVISELSVLALFVPLSEMTKNLVDKNILNLAKSDLKILNLGRGGVVNEEDLYEFLQGNSQASAYLDVWENDPELTVNIQKLMKLPNCLVTPHIATMTEESVEKMHYFDIFGDEA